MFSLSPPRCAHPVGAPEVPNMTMLLWIEFKSSTRFPIKQKPCRTDLEEMTKEVLHRPGDAGWAISPVCLIFFNDNDSVP